MQDILLFLQAHWQLTSALVIVLALLVIVEFIKGAQKTSQLSTTRATTLINHQNAIVVDVRSTDAYANGHIISALSLPLSDFNDKLKKIEPFKSQPIIVVCATGNDAAQAAKTLKQRAFTEVYVLAGGIRAWKEAGMPLIKG